MRPQPRLWVVSHVLPFPGQAGQEQRVRYTLHALRDYFHVTFLTFAAERERANVEAQLSSYVDTPLVWPSRVEAGIAPRLWHGAASRAFAWKTGLKPSNYTIGRVEFEPARLRAGLAEAQCDVALFEYWHAVNATSVFREKGIPCVLDMHNILWQAHAQRLAEQSRAPAWWRERSRRLYQQGEERAWDEFDALITINRQEHDYVAGRCQRKLFYAPMGIDLSLWPFSREPANPPRLAYYGGLGTIHNQEAALRCHEKIMPRIWREFPKAELWLVGSAPPDRLRALTTDPRIHVTGFVEKVQDVLRTMSVVLCPWTGTYGFRSRLVEVMALGVPVIGTAEAAAGMELTHEQGILFGADDDALAEHALRLLKQTSFAAEQSRRAREQMEALYSVESTYGRLARDLADWLADRQAERQVCCA